MTSAVVGAEKFSTRGSGSKGPPPPAAAMNQPMTTPTNVNTPVTTD